MCLRGKPFLAKYIGRRQSKGAALSQLSRSAVRYPDFSLLPPVPKVISQPAIMPKQEITEIENHGISAGMQLLLCTAGHFGMSCNLSTLFLGQQE